MEGSWLGLEGKVSIVTGGASGVGAHIVNELLRNHVQVVVADHKVTTGKKRDGTFHIQCDVTKKDDIEQMVKVVKGKFKQIDILINNAGVNVPGLLVDYRGEKHEYEASEEDFNYMVSVNQKGPFLCTQAVARDMIKNNSGVIINVTSIAANEGSQGQSIYVATKSALNGYTKSWAKELGKFNIRVIGIAPGINEKTGLTSTFYNKALAYIRETSIDNLNQDYHESIPLGRIGRLEEIGDLVAYLVSDRASYITGTTINISGGKSVS